jgi:hypothetical protein
MWHEHVERCAWQRTSVCTYLRVTDRMLKVRRLTLEEAVNSGYGFCWSLKYVKICFYVMTLSVQTLIIIISF